MTRIGVDFSVTSGKFQGSRSYLFGLYGAAIAALPNYEFWLYTHDPEHLFDWAPARSSNVRLVKIEKRGGAYGRLALWLPQAIRRDHIDIIHTQYMIPITNSAKCITTIHDILFEDYPQFFPFGFRMRSKLLIHAAAKMADSVLTVSHYSAARIIEKYGIDPEKVRVTANGVDRTHFNGAVREEEFYHSLGIDGTGYILVVGRIEARKNISTLIAAYARLERPRPQLVIVGNADTKFFDGAIDFEATALGEIVHLSSISDADLPALYAGSGLFVYPSFAEGFGMPLIEAMSSGVPVVCSSATALPEVVDDAALIADPTDIQAFSDAMRRVLVDSTLRERLRVAGLSRANYYSWNAAACQLKESIDALA